jgi:hypothetical protein
VTCGPVAVRNGRRQRQTGRRKQRQREFERRKSEMREEDIFVGTCMDCMVQPWR